MKVFIYGQRFKDNDLEYFNILLEVLSEEGVAYKIFDSYLEQIKAYRAVDVQHFGSYEDLKAERPDFIITLGGDGTILSAMTLIRELSIPVIGINLGRMGFLSSIEKTRIKEALLLIKAGKFKRKERSMLALQTKEKLFGDTPFALNDFTITKRDNSAMVTIHTYVGGDFLNSYWADGIIVSTPTGSTGYSLSCGGPIIYPGSGNFVITPIAPHNLNVRPIVIPDSEVLSFEVEGRSENFLCTLDARFETITTHNKLSLSRCSFNAVLAVLEDFRFLNTIRSKLHWGLDKRN